MFFAPGYPACPCTTVLHTGAVTAADYYGAGPPTDTEYVSSHPDVKLVAADHGRLTEALKTYLEAAGKGPDGIYTMGFDLCAPVLEGIRRGSTWCSTSSPSCKGICQSCRSA